MMAGQNDSVHCESFGADYGKVLVSCMNLFTAKNTQGIAFTQVGKSEQNENDCEKGDEEAAALWRDCLQSLSLRLCMEQKSIFTFFVL